MLVFIVFGDKKGGKPEDRTIDSSFHKINIPDFDNFFKEASEALDDAEQLRSGIEDSKEKGAQISHTFLLVNGAKFVDTIQVLLWAASADCGGKIEDANVSTTHTPPYFNINKGKLNPDTYNLAVLVETYLQTIMDAPKLMEDLVEKLVDLVERTPALIENAKSDIENSSLTFTAKLKATADILKNEAKLAKQLYKCKELKQVVLEAKQDFLELIPRLKDLVLTANEIGAKAAADKLAKPSDIFDKYFPGPKKPLPPPTTTTPSTPSTTPSTNTPAKPATPSTTPSTTTPSTTTPSTQPAATPSTNNTSPAKPADTKPADTKPAETKPKHHHPHPHQSQGFTETISETITETITVNGVTTTTTVKMQETIGLPQPQHHHVKHHHKQEF